MEPVRSRCLCVRVPAPSLAGVQEQLSLVARRESFALPPPLCARVAALSQRNLRRALLMLEVAYVQGGGQLGEDAKVAPPDWELYIAVSAAAHDVLRWLACASGCVAALVWLGCLCACGACLCVAGVQPTDLQARRPVTTAMQEVANDMLGEQTPRRLLAVRGKLYELLGNCIPPELILRSLLVELLKKLDDELKVQVAEQAAVYEHRLQEGQKAIFHLEAFVAKFMSIYKNWMLATLAG